MSTNRSYNFWQKNDEATCSQMGIGAGRYNTDGTNLYGRQWAGNGNGGVSVPYSSIPRAMYANPPMPNFQSDNVSSPLQCPNYYLNQEGPVLENGEAFAFYTGINMNMNTAMGPNGGQSFW
ncbi:uncharacterized protein LOC115631105 isoform X2 [Scaptodrosophila lebanonensis]|uniref:Uncharacterized protein LOC115631105 isoform X2 n=1 Tax=Drosophila lebanonensis TaxID=7225 RepID=A0A6J2U7U7_DROLE|nr:uncharacterized protein LOC115631105 isoform X2 [Scaptodrosophila lebanonensis]